MPVVDLQEASDVSQVVERLFAAPDFPAAVQRVRQLFVEKLDFDPASGSIAFHHDTLPSEAARVAQRDGVQVIALQLPGKVLAASLRTALQQLRGTLAGDPFVVVADAARSQWHFVYPSLQDGRETLRRMVVHRGQPHRTIAQQLASVYTGTSRGGDLRAALDRAYDVEAVTKKFFERYREIFNQVMGLVEGLPDLEERKLFCQTLFNRLMFLYFLQRKGWLTFNGSADYLEALWRDAQRQPDQNFYETRLKHLFFTGLNRPHAAATRLDHMQQVLQPLIGDVPFLNGGLFDGDDPLDQRPGIVVPNEAIRLILRELFARFNFTIAESTPYDVEVAVDPEMLGKVFEELVTGRHESGSYYTPRPIVAFMCREALKQHLQTHVDGLSAESAEAFVDDRDLARAGLNVQQARQVLEALETITVVDPACGSGAYLLGMLHELIELQSLLYSSSLIRDSKSLYELKLRVIEGNIYGADLDPFATNIAMLRLWLSLVIDYEGPGDPPALPNLDFKIVTGDSLSAPDPNPELETDMFRSRAHQDAAELSRLKAEFLRKQGEEKRFLAQQIEAKQKQLAGMLAHAAAPDGSVDWRVQFAEVFDGQGGFDVVLANPPYIRQELIRSKKPALRTVYGNLFVSTADLYVYFYYRAYQLLARGGVLAFISSNKWLRAAYGEKLRQLLSACTRLHAIIDFRDLPVFGAIAYPGIVVARKAPARARQVRVLVPETLERINDLRAALDEDGKLVDSDELGSGTWSFGNGPTRELFEQMARASVPLLEYVGGRIFRGVITGLNDAFVIPRAVRDALIAADDRSANVLRPFLRGRDVDRWNVSFAGMYLLRISHGETLSWLGYTGQRLSSQQRREIVASLTQDGLAWREFRKRYPAVAAYLEPFRATAEKRLDKGDFWWELRPCDYYDCFEMDKLIYPELARTSEFTLDTSKSYIDSTLYTIPCRDLYLLGVMNSRSVHNIYLNMCAQVRGNYFRYKRQYVENIPIPRAQESDRQYVAELVQKCLVARGVSNNVVQWEAEMDACVAELYGLHRS